MVWRALSLILVALTLSCGGEAPQRPIPGKISADSGRKTSGAEGDSDISNSPSSSSSSSSSSSFSSKGYDVNVEGYKLLMKNCLLCHDQFKDKEFFKTISKSSYKAILENRMPKSNPNFFKSNDKNLLLNWLATEFSAGPVVK
jgi:hypothetical protein